MKIDIFWSILSISHPSRFSLAILFSRKSSANSRWLSDHPLLWSQSTLLIAVSAHCVHQSLAGPTTRNSIFTFVLPVPGTVPGPCSQCEPNLLFGYAPGPLPATLLSFSNQLCLLPPFFVHHTLSASFYLDWISGLIFNGPPSFKPIYSFYALLVPWGYCNKAQEVRWLKHQKCAVSQSGDWKSKITMSVGLVPSEGSEGTRVPCLSPSFQWPHRFLVCRWCPLCLRIVLLLQMSVSGAKFPLFRRTPVILY